MSATVKGVGEEASAANDVSGVQRRVRSGVSAPWQSRVYGLMRLLSGGAGLIGSNYTRSLMKGDGDAWCSDANVLAREVVVVYPAACFPRLRRLPCPWRRGVGKSIIAEE